MRLRFFVVTAALLSASLMARADTYTTFDLASTYSNGGTIDGTLTLDDTTDLFTRANLTLSGFPSGEDSALTDIVGQGNYGSYSMLVSGYDGSLLLYLPTDAIGGYAGSSICTNSFVSPCVDLTLYEAESGNYVATSGSLTEVVVAPPPAVTPEPTGIALLGTGLLGLAGVVRRRFV